jgi:hypothetical protein
MVFLGVTVSAVLPALAAVVLLREVRPAARP